MEAHLGTTTNLFLGVIAFTSALEALLILGVLAAVYVLFRRMNAVYREVMAVVQGVEARHLAPTMGRVNAILDDVKVVSSTVRRDTESVDEAMRTTKGRVVGIVKGAGLALRAFLKYAA